jgi:RNase adaptor protein for sRNA GlmZ degradation
MEIVFIYGPPAVGKLTVARALSKITNFPVLHNHLIVDLLGVVFDWGSKPFRQLNDKIRMDLIEAASKQDLPGLIITFVYECPTDDKIIKQLIRLVQRHKGNIRFVQLKCDQKFLFRRVRHASRREFHKLHDAKALKRCLSKWNWTSAIESVENLTIDNTSRSAKRVAKEIATCFRLKRR